MIQKGARALSDLELLAILLGSGDRNNSVLTLAGRILKALDQKTDGIDVRDLLAIQGVGLAKASLIMASLEFARRRIQPHGVKIANARDVFPMLRYLADRPQEHFLCVSLNGAHEVICVRTVSVGLVNRALVHPREVFADPITDQSCCRYCRP